MASRPKFSEAATLEQYRISLENAKNQPMIASALSEINYDPDTLAIGEALFQETKQAYEKNKIEDDETSEVYQRFEESRDELVSRYKRDRKKARIILREDQLTARKLAVDGSLPRAYIALMEAINTFYKAAAADSDILAKLGKLNITPDDVSDMIGLTQTVEEARANYLREVGESQDATKTKDAAFKKMDAWMRDFYDVAKIALEDNPQLLESLGKQVKS